VIVSAGGYWNFLQMLWYAQQTQISEFMDPLLNKKVRHTTL